MFSSVLASMGQLYVHFPMWAQHANKQGATKFGDAFFGVTIPYSRLQNIIVKSVGSPLVLLPTQDSAATKV